MSQENPPDAILELGWRSTSMLAMEATDEMARAYLTSAAQMLNCARERLWFVEGEDRE